MAGREGIFARDAGTVDAEGFIAPEVGLVDHALYFTTAPDVLTKTHQVLDADRLELPGAVIVWDETIGRRKGAKAVPGSWWAATGSVTMTLVFDGDLAADDLLAPAVDAVLQAINSFGPDVAATHVGEGQLMIAGRSLGRVAHHSYAGTEIFVVRVNAATDFAKAPEAVRDSQVRLADHIDVSALPLNDAATLPNALSQAIMTELPRAWSTG